MKILNRICYFILLIIILILLLMKFFYIDRKTKDTTVPDIINLKIDDGISALNEKKLKYEIIYLDSTNDLIEKTFPKANSNVKEYSTVKVYLNQIKEITYPNYIGLHIDDVKDELIMFCNDNNLDYNINYIESDNGIDGIILDQDKYDSDTINGDITLYVNKVTDTFYIPSFIYKSLNEVIQILNDNNIPYYCIYEASILPFNTIIAQSVKDKEIVKNSKNVIYLYVSRGIDLDCFLDSSKSIDELISLYEKSSINYQIKYVMSNDFPNKIIEICAEMNYDISDIVLTIYVTKN